jgi:integrase
MQILLLYPGFVSRKVLSAMNENITETSRDTKTPKALREQHLSNDGKWRSFPKVPNLLQYVRRNGTGTYFARVKVNGKLFRQSLGTTVYTDAKDKLPDFLKKNRGKTFAVGTFGDALNKYQQDLALDHAISDATKRYRAFCIKTLLSSWQGLAEASLSRIKPEDCKAWASKLAGEKDEQYFNNVLGTLRAIFRKAGITGSDDPSKEVKRLGVKPKPMTLLTPEQFHKLTSHLEQSSAWKAQRSADLIRFLAYSGCRISEARKVTWADVDLSGGFIRVQNAKLRNASNHAITRDVPIIGEMRVLLERLKVDHDENENGKVLPFGECEKSLTSACEALGLPRQTHHDFRHLFATFAIQAGVDVPTVAEWLGHKDRGALAMRVYTHHQHGHSLAMAKKVSFGPKAEAA